jgi:hypothetical protein
MAGLLGGGGNQNGGNGGLLGGLVTIHNPNYLGENGISETGILLIF